ncbi:hypothetical protein MLD38_024416 [Melastoma candidum]|uniref:Uncharacterized protein n=1 Tax=Melastoma candidum TaxID=119954 RepID=A0ACB9NVM1_9MYRT|nr:hypothetical protein MLD38_024416 [Melastoma candidum]
MMEKTSIHQAFSSIMSLLPPSPSQLSDCPPQLPRLGLRGGSSSLQTLRVRSVLASPAGPRVRICHSKLDPLAAKHTAHAAAKTLELVVVEEEEVTPTTPADVGGMGSSSDKMALPLLTTPVESNYRACTIPFRFPSDNPRRSTPDEIAWIDLFLDSIPSFRKRAESDPTVPDAADRARMFAERYSQILEHMKRDPQSHGGPPDCILLCRIREQVLRELGFRDIFKRVKEEENAKAISLFSHVVQLNDSIEDDDQRLENLIRGVFAGNIFDLGSGELAKVFSKNGMSFLATYQNLVSRPWVIDDLDSFKQTWSRKSWKKAIICVDNSGADIILGILPFARELLRRGTQVVIAANELPSVNDVTYYELIDILSKLKDEDGQLMGVDASNLLVISSGNDLPVIDLSRVSQELAYIANDADLVILEGMGRGIETNLYAKFKCDSLKIGMVKHPEVAEFLGGRLYDCVIKFTPV